MVSPAHGPLRPLELYTVSPGVDVEPAPAQEPDEGHPELPGHVDGEAARGGDGAHDRSAGHQGLLQDLEAAATADHDYVLRQRQPALQKRPADELVRGVVPSDVLPERDELSFLIEERRRVQAARRVEEPLRLPEFVRQGVDGLWLNQRTRRDDRATTQLQLLEACLAAHAAGARGVEMPLERTQVELTPASQLDVH